MSSSNGVLTTPQTTIGAQELLSVGCCTQAGFIRQQGRLERMFKFKKWRLRFAVISRGCLYIFDNELASQPNESYSLKIFNRLERNQVGNVVWPLHIIPASLSREKHLQFSCVSESERKIWMQQLKRAMILAHQVSTALLNEDRVNYDDYVYLEKPIPREPAPLPEVQTPDDDPGGESEYTEIDELEVEFKKGWPVSNGNNKSQSLRETENAMTPVARKKTKTLPQLPTNIVSRKAFEYGGSDRTEIARILTERPEGTYLVRKSRSDGREVLSVNVEGVLKEFKIYLKDNEVTINNENYFSSVEEMIKYYRDHPLPNKSTKLYLAYSVTDPRYKYQ